ncbi:MAG: hypothetical protein HXY34_06015 [Candidatus Thorarchaeota archaeon]|nr:hypothetical protein [Candidatus Thorarchaeota archaeon]
MPQAVFVLHLDDYQGFVVAKRYPPTFSVNEKMLNLVYYLHGEGKKADIKLIDVEGRRMATYSSEEHPGWLVCFALNIEEDFVQNSKKLAGMGRFILELATRSPDYLEIGEIIRKGAVIEEPTNEQVCARVFLTPSSTLLLDKLQSEGIQKSKTMEIWLRDQLQARDVDLRTAVFPLMDAGLVKVEMVGRDEHSTPPRSGVETVFLIRDLFCYRAPPSESMETTRATHPEITEEYRKYVESFFAGYNPTAQTEDPNSPQVADRETIARRVSDRISYIVIGLLRKGALSVKEISRAAVLPHELVQKILFNMESEKIAVHFPDCDCWALISDPAFETFIPEYVLPVVAQKYVENQIDAESARRYFELLVETWGDGND